ncbi:hypothetical protein NLU13_7654 [Sarocladium strictum]|uniref:Pyrroloquinoline quinone-dependent pyranose dehydrogenase beta-propeller domain-containing protein n=1 Tax=Sarocladium strictum TaxID=5046 RepID=A0AA39GDI1_SARSR|nr:hypothetical protein NLU13_7654 [Sarocladium strictum]
MPTSPTASSILLALLLAATSTTAQSCSNEKSVRYQEPVAADGWSYRLIADGFTRPRGLVFDADGHLLVVDSGVGVVRLRLKDDGGTCLSVEHKSTIIEDDELNHGLALSENGDWIYASSVENVYRWRYTTSGDPSGRQTLVTNMTNGGHSTRTLLLPPSNPNLLLVSRGSDGNDDDGARDINSGRSQLRSFNLSTIDGNSDPIDYINGDVLAWGLRNSVGVAEHPSGGIWTVENSMDNLERDGKDIHKDNPGEEMNYHGMLNESSDETGANYGYPVCLALWSTDNFPARGALTTGDQFSMEQTRQISDQKCNDDYISPRLTFQAHTAPLDIKFNQNGSEAFISFHGSWNREDPVGYNIASVSFSSGQPSANKSSTTAAKPILSNKDLSKCPDECFRPVGLAWDKEGRLFFSSDSTGEVFVLQKDSGSGGSGGGGGNAGGSGNDQGADSGDDEDSVPGLYSTRSAVWAVTFAAIVVGMLLA